MRPQPVPEAPVERGAIALACGLTVPGTRYRIDQWLGEGGMGSVYAATHLDIDRRTALKILHGHLTTSPELVSMFRDEAKAASRVGSEYIVDVTDFVALADGRLMLVMELLEGASLHAEATERGMDPRRLIGILRQACKGASAAHDAGIVHRDIKPANLWMQTRPGRPERLKLMDFGIAAFGGSDGRGDARRGTPYYMAPEQIEGRPFDGRLDVYALGCTAYRLVAGRPPFMGAERAAVLDKHLNLDPRSLDERCGEAELPKALCRVVMRCLAKAPDDRYSNMRELEAAVCEAQIECGLATPWDGLPIPDIDPERRARILERMPGEKVAAPRSRVFVAGAAIGAVAVATALSGWLLSGQEDPGPRGDVESLEQQALAAAARAHFVYPPMDDPGQATAYLAVLDLERRKSELGSTAEETAQALRDEFSQTLTSLGDKYWDEPHGRPFAADYYAQALVFDAENTRARERTGISLGQLVTLEAKAQGSTFTESELAAVAPLVILAEPDVERRTAALKRLVDEENPRALSATSAVARFIGAPAKPTRPIIGAAPDPPVEPAETRTPPVIGAASEPPAERADAQAGGAVRDNKTRDEPRSVAGHNRDPKAARRLATQARTAFDRGDWAGAQQGFQSALALDSQCAVALGGLSDLYFEKNAIHKAVRYAKKAVRAAPKDGAQHLRLGDAYYAALRLGDARDAYVRARQLGHPKAAKRLARLDSKLGGESGSASQVRPR